jgi:glyoxylase-like metal-dependent hydrolase (beta-lactamase superfamily II)
MKRQVMQSLALTTLLLIFAHAPAQTRTTHVAGNIYLITGVGGNVTASVGENGVMLIDAGDAESTHELLAAIKALTDGTIQYIINTSVAPDHMGGNVEVRAAGDTFTGGNATVVAGVDEGAEVIGHENGLLRLASDGVPIERLPTETFFVPRLDKYFNGEPVELFYRANAVDDTNIVVHFRRSDVIVTGDVFRLDRYPSIDLEHGGSINGILDTLNWLVELAVTDKLSEGGTLLVPGHGRIADEGDLLRYRDMLTVIRDRVAAMIESGHSLREIQRMALTLEYESRWGRDSQWTGEDFVAAVYESLMQEQS